MDRLKKAFWLMICLALLLFAQPIPAQAQSGGGGWGGDDGDVLPPDLDPESANMFAFEGPPGADQTDEVTGEDINQANITTNGRINVPTDALASPLHGAALFDQQMLRFEEFGPVPLGPAASVVPGSAFPPPQDSHTGPTDTALESFLTQYVTPTKALPFPFPTREANEVQANPWQTQIEAFLTRPLDNPPAEGRPPGEGWAHQRWDEFPVELYYNTVQADARVNTGFRDDLQEHEYLKGEFAPGGLYHNTTGNPGFEGTTKGIEVQFHPDFEIQVDNALWTWDGTFPPKLLQNRYGVPVLMRHYNALPIAPQANRGFGLHTITTHEHNGHHGAESDGFTQAFFFPGQFYDYRWPWVIAGYDTINTSATDPRAGAPDGSGGITNLRGDWREIMSTHWFHDHMLDFTATNVYKGNVAMSNIYSSVDRGREPTTPAEASSPGAYGCTYANNSAVNLCFPSGTGLDWGNRDYDVNLVIADKAWDSDDQLFFNIFNLDGWLGDQILTNWLWKPYLDVRARRYRFRILNGAVSRYFRFALVEQVNGSGGEMSGTSGSGISYNRVPFHMIANDGNILEHAVYFDGNTTIGGLTNERGVLPTQGIAERYDIIVDFAQFPVGTKLYMVNLLEHEDGKNPERPISLASVLNGSYHGRTSEPADQPATVDGRNVTDPTVARFLELRVQPYSGTDNSMDPADFVAGKSKMIPLPGFTQAELDGALHRTFEFGRGRSRDGAPWTIATDGGAGFGMDPRRLSAAPARDAGVEIWRIENGHCGWSHAVHVHFEEGQIIRRDGREPPEWEKWARKDVYRIGCMDDSGFSVDMAIRFREFLGSFMEHCHNTQHEDHAMLLRWDIENPGAVDFMPTPMPSWDGVGFVDTFALPTARTGDGTGLNGGGGGGWGGN